MKTAFFFTLLVMVQGLSWQAHAAPKRRAVASTAPPPSEPVASEHKHIISPLLGFMGPGTNSISDNVNGTDTSSSLTLSGLFGIGADYEYMLKDDFSIGGFFRYYTTNDTLGTTDDTETAYLIGGLAHAYIINTNHFSGYVASGLTTVKVSQKVTPKGGTAKTLDPSMTVGLPFVFGVGYKLTDTLTLGIEHMQVMALGDKVNGWPVSDFMARLRIAL